MWLQYLEIVVLTLINSGGIFLIIVLLANSLHEKLYRWLTVMIVCIIGWVNFVYLAYIDPDPFRAVILYRLNFSCVAIIMFAEYMLYIESFLKIRIRILKWTVGIISFFFFFITFVSDSVIANATWQGWGNEIIFGPFNSFFNVFAFVLNIGIVIALISKYYSLNVPDKKKTLYFLIGTFCFIFFNIFFNIFVPEIFGTARYQHFGDYSSVLFLIFTAYAILRYKFMNVKIALTALLIGAIGMLVIIDIFSLSHSVFELSIKIAILILFVIISILLVRSVLKEIRQREELAKSNTALKQSRAKYMDLAKEQEDIIDIIGHELRAPLATILQTIYLYKETSLPYKQKMTQMMKKDAILTERIKLMFDSFSSVERSSKHALTLVHTLLETVRIDTDMVRITKTEFDLAELVKEVADSYVLLMPESVQVSLQIPEDLFHISADKIKIEQAIHELIQNGVKYGRAGEEQKSHLIVSLEKSKKAIILSVRDHGRGIEKKDIPLLGSKFTRLNKRTDQTVLKQPGGTGLGLYIVRKYMEKHGGKLVIESDGLNEGATFSLIIPTTLPL